VLPLAAIRESLRPGPGCVHRVPGAGELITVRAAALPLVRLHHVFGLAAAPADPTAGLVVVVEHEGERVALLADELLGQQQVVVKSLETHFRRLEGFAGATILGDGRVALILDVPGLVAQARRRPAEGEGPTPAQVGRGAGRSPDRTLTGAPW
jgi:two-component system chemotaxis sensor kinase CheA